MNGYAAETAALTEAEALKRFEAENFRLRAITARIGELSAESRAWSLLPNPELSFSREEAAGTRDSFFMINQSLPLSGRLGFLREAGKASIRAAEAGARYEAALLRADLQTAFFGLLLAQRKTALVEDWLARFKEVVGILRAREKEGDVSRFDLLRAERELAETEMQAADRRIELRQAQALLAAFIDWNEPVSSLSAQGEFVKAEAIPPLEVVLARGLEVRGDALAAGYAAERFGLESRAARRRMIPDPVLGAGIKRTEIPGLSGSGLFLSVSLPLPLFNGGGTDYARAQAAAERSRAEASAIRREIETEVAAAHETALLRRRLADEYVRGLGEKGTELSEIGRLAYDEGESGILELLDAFRQALFSRMQAIALAWGAKQAEIDLNRLVGEEVVK